MTENKSTNPTIQEMVTPALGYLFVVLICIMAGKSLHHDLSFFEFISISPEQFLYWLLLVPVFINRVIMYEQPSHKSISNIDKEWRKVSLQLPIVIFFFTLFVFLFLNNCFKSSGYYSTFHFESDKIYAMIAGLLPLYLQTFISWNKWKNKKAKEHFNFRHYILFPALSTCIISFLVGWTELKNISVIAVPSVVIIIYYFISFFDKTNIKNWKISDWIILIGLVGVFFYEFFIAIPFKISSTTPIDAKNSFMIILSCVMMSIIMGITETWWLIKDSDNKEKFTSEDIGFYENRINKVTASFPLIMPIFIFDPHTNIFFYSILIYAILLCVIWFYCQGIPAKYWRWIRFSFGIILPIFFAISLRDDFNGIQSIVSNKSFINMLSVAGVLLGVISFLKVFVKKSDKFFTELSSDKLIGIMICIVFQIFLFTLSQIIPTTESKLVEKVNLLILFYFVILLVFLIEIILKMLKYDNSSQESDSKNSNSKNMLLFFESGRPLTSLLSGILSFIIIYEVQQDILLSFLKSIPIVIVTMLGFIYNDIYDRSKDLQAGKKRPITTGNLSTSVATKLTLITAIFIVVYEIALNNFYSFGIILITLIGVIFYSPISKKYPLVKIFYTAMLCCAPLIYGYAVVGNSILWYKFIPIIIFIIGREIWLDKIDMQGDISSNIKNITFYLGNKNSFWTAFGLMSTGGLTVLLCVTTRLGFVISVSSVISLLICYFLAIKNEPLAIKISRIPMLLGILALTI